MVETTKKMPRQVNDMVNMARLSEWRRLEIMVAQADRKLGSMASVSILAHAGSFGSLRELALSFDAELVGERFIAEYDGGVTLEVVRPESSGARATYHATTTAGYSQLDGKTAIIQWGPRWKDGIVLAQFDDSKLRSQAGTPLWTGWHEFPSQDFIVHA